MNSEEMKQKIKDLEIENRRLRMQRFEGNQSNTADETRNGQQNGVSISESYNRKQRRNEILAIEDTLERQRTIRENRELFR